MSEGHPEGGLAEFIVYFFYDNLSARLYTNARDARGSDDVIKRKTDKGLTYIARRMT